MTGMSQINLPFDTDSDALSSDIDAQLSELVTLGNGMAVVVGVRTF